MHTLYIDKYILYICVHVSQYVPILLYTRNDVHFDRNTLKYEIPHFFFLHSFVITFFLFTFHSLIFFYYVSVHSLLFIHFLSSWNAQCGVEPTEKTKDASNVCLRKKKKKLNVQYFQCHILSWQTNVNQEKSCCCHYPLNAFHHLYSCKIHLHTTKIKLNTVTVWKQIIKSTYKY